MSKGWIQAPLAPEVLRTEALILRTAHRLLKTIGPGHREAVYRKFLVHALRGLGTEVVQHRFYAMEFDGLRDERAAQPDLVVNEHVVVDLKSVEAIHPKHRAQLISYLRASGISRGILLNFNVARFRDAYDLVVHPDLLRREDEHALGSSGSPGSRVSIEGHDTGNGPPKP